MKQGDQARGRVFWFDLSKFLFAFKNKAECTNLPRYKTIILQKVNALVILLSSFIFEIFLKLHFIFKEIR